MLKPPNFFSQGCCFSRVGKLSEDCLFKALWRAGRGKGIGKNERERIRKWKRTRKMKRDREDGRVGTRSRLE